MSTYQIHSESERQTIDMGKKLAAVLEKGDLILLDGDLGAGKTHFVKGVAEGLGSKDIVTSPTFNLVNFYQANDLTILHIDLYRLEGIEEFNDLGVFEYFEDAVVLMEWGQKIADSLEDYILLEIQPLDVEKDTRSLTFNAIGTQYYSKIDLIKKTLANDE